MKIRTEYTAGRLTVYLIGELDHHSARLAMTDIDEAVERRLPRDMILDLSELSFMDSSGIAVILKANRKVRDNGGRMYVDNPQAQPLKVIDAAGLDRLIPIAAAGEVRT